MLRVLWGQRWAEGGLCAGADAGGDDQTVGDVRRAGTAQIGRLVRDWLGVLMNSDMYGVCPENDSEREVAMLGGKRNGTYVQSCLPTLRGMKCKGWTCMS
jgi:hypothetical protein